MDRGAARSRREEERRNNSALTLSVKPKATSSRAGQARPRSEEVSIAKATTSRFKPKVIDNTDPSRFRPKAVRESAALLWFQGEFAIPPSSDTLSRVTRIDLCGSGCNDVSWLEGTKVTWLNLKGCRISKGWDAVGSLVDLAVLNISETGLDRLPEELSGLRKLKALVAMGNPWAKLDSSVLEQWDQLNSIIVSHSPKLKSLPTALIKLRHLAKISFSHCPCIQAGGLPDLTDLPLLRDVKLNNLALLDRLPSHLATWGTGVLPASEHVLTPRRGDGLEVLDLGNCSLPFSTVEAVLLHKKWPHLRSLSLHSNPLAVSNPEYAAQLRDSDKLPNLQIIDAKRVVERKRKGEIQETRLERRRRLKKERGRSTGSNAKVLPDKSRTWGGTTVGGEGSEDVSVSERVNSSAGLSDAGISGTPSGILERKRKRRREEQRHPTAAPDSLGPTKEAPSTSTVSKDGANSSGKKRKRAKHRNEALETTLVDNKTIGNEKRTASRFPPDSAPSKNDLDSRGESQPVRSTSRPGAKAQGGKVETIIKSAGGVNLKDILSKPKIQQGPGDLGLGGW